MIYFNQYVDDGNAEVPISIIFMYKETSRLIQNILLMKTSQTSIIMQHRYPPFQTQEPKTRLNHPFCCCCFPDVDAFLPLEPFPFTLPFGTGGALPFHTGICVAFHIGWGFGFQVGGGYGRISTADDRRLKRP